MALPPALELEGRGLLVFAALARGGLLVDGFEVVVQDMRVYLGRADVRVAEHFLDVTHAGSAAEHFSGAGMTEAVGGNEVLGDVGGCRRCFDDALQVLRLHGVAGDRQKEAVAIFGTAVVAQVVGTDSFDVFGAPVERLSADRDEAVFLSFALHDANAAFLVVEVVNGQPAEFPRPQAGGVEQFEDSAVSEADFRSRVRLPEQSDHLFAAQDRARQPSRDFELRKIGGGVGKDLSALVQEREERFEVPELHVLRCDANRALREPFAVAREVAQLDVAQVKIGEGGRKLFDAAEVALDRAVGQVPRFEMFAVKVKHRRADGSCDGCGAARPGPLAGSVGWFGGCRDRGVFGCGACPRRVGACSLRAGDGSSAR